MDKFVEIVINDQSSRKMNGKEYAAFINCDEGMWSAIRNGRKPTAGFKINAFKALKTEHPELEQYL